MSLQPVDLAAIEDVVEAIDDLGFDVDGVREAEPANHGIAFAIEVRATTRFSTVDGDDSEEIGAPSDGGGAAEAAALDGEQDVQDEDWSQASTQQWEVSEQDLPQPTDEGDPFHGDQERSVQDDEDTESVDETPDETEGGGNEREEDVQEDDMPSAPTADTLGISGVQGETYDAIRDAGEIGAADLADELDVSKGTIYGRVHDLKDLGVLDTVQDGKAKLYRIADGLDGLVDEDAQEAGVADGGAVAVPAGASTAPDSWPTCGACGRPVSPDWARVNAEDPENPQYCPDNECPATKARGEVREKRSGRLSTVEGHDV